MNTLRRLALVGLTIGMVASAMEASERSASAPQCALTIVVQNSSRVDSATLQQAQEVASTIFRNAGVATNWIDLNKIAQNHPDNQAPIQIPEAHVQIMIISESSAQGAELRGDAMGLAPGAGPGRKLVYVMYDRVDALFLAEIANRRINGSAAMASRPQILGAVIAHEVGHVLLNLGVHTPTGIMRGPWNDNDLANISSGHLEFSNEQSEILRLETIRRGGAMQVAKNSQPGPPGK